MAKIKVPVIRGRKGKRFHKSAGGRRANLVKNGTVYVNKRKPRTVVKKEIKTTVLKPWGKMVKRVTWAPGQRGQWNRAIRMINLKYKK